MLTVVYCTKESKPEHKEHLIKSSGLHKHIEVIEIINKGESLTKCYNRGLKQAKNDIIVFCHDDIIIETKQWGKKLMKQFDTNEQIGIIGVAGSKFMNTTGRWWDDRKTMYGRVKHTHNGKSWLSAYSPDQGNNLEPVLNVDGVWFAVHKERIKEEFDESVEGFHFYDVDFSFSNHLAGCGVAVTTKIRVNHMSIGETNDEWEANRVIFSEKHKERLPLKINQTFENRRLKILLCCLSFKKLTGSELSTFELAKNLIEKGCDVSIYSNIGGQLSIEAKKLGIKLYDINNPPSYRLGDGVWTLKSNKGDIIKSEPNKFYKINNIEFDVIQCNHKPITQRMLNLYPNSKFVNIVRSRLLELEDPIIDDRITDYIAINELVKNHLINEFSIPEKKIKLIYNIVDVKDTNMNNFIKPEKKLFVFPGTMNYLRKKPVHDAVEYTKDKGELWLIGDDNDFGYAKKLSEENEHVKYISTTKDMGSIYTICDTVLGLHLGRTLIEGLVSGKECIGYDVDKVGNILNREDITKMYDINLFSKEQIINSYIDLYIDHYNRY